MIAFLPLLTAAGSAVGKVLQSVPWQAWALAAAVAACWYYGEARADQREAEVRAEYEALMYQRDEAAAQFLAEETEQARRREQALADQIIQADARHAQAIHDAETRAARTVADLRRGSIKLRQHWQACLSQPRPTPGDPGGTDEGADLRAADIGRVQRIAAECDADVKWWQTTCNAAVKAVNAPATGD